MGDEKSRGTRTTGQTKNTMQKQGGGCCCTGDSITVYFNGCFSHVIRQKNTVIWERTTRF